MALNWSLVIFFAFGLIWTISTIRNAYRFATSHEELNFTQIVASHGYTAEEYTVQTEDGYLLSVFRIPESSNCTKNEKKSPVLLMNGLLATSDSFLDSGMKMGLPYLISDACFDLWVGNVRGTYHGRRHVTLNPDWSEEFWDFSSDEIGYYDVPATVDFVLNHTGVSQLNYIGISQGSGTFFMMCSERPEYCDKVKLFVGVAPASKHTHCKSFMFRMVTTFFRDNLAFLQSIGVNEMLWKGYIDVFQVFCRYDPKICEAVVAFIDKPHMGSISVETWKTALEHFPAGTSTKNLARFGQSVNGQRFCKFDYGREKNIKMYDSAVPPDYDLTAVTAPSVIIYGKNDGIVDEKDIEWLVRGLPNVQALMEMEDPLWNHLDMVIGKEIPEMLFPKILKYLQIYNTENANNVTIPGS